MVIEHNLHVIKQADWVVDLGPEGGERGESSSSRALPKHLVARGRGHTARHLRRILPRAQWRHCLTAFRSICYHRQSWQGTRMTRSGAGSGWCLPGPWRSPSP